jgi:hypothetical protein
MSKNALIIQKVQPEICGISGEIPLHGVVIEI